MDELVRFAKWTLLGLALVVAMGFLYAWASNLESCHEKHRRQARALAERRRAMTEESTRRVKAIVSTLGGAVRVDCKEKDVHWNAGWAVHECSAILIDGRWLRAVCDVGQAPGCRIDWIGREGGPAAVVEEEENNQ
jgi:hypothetical protein